MSKLAAILFDHHEPVDALMAEAIAGLAPSGLRIGGVIQVAAEACGGCAGPMHLRDLASGADWAILQNLGREARACRLDSQALAEVASRVQTSLRSGIDLLIINRFGKAESEGHGLRPIFGEAFASGVPILTAVRRDHRAAWCAFHGGLAAELPLDAARVATWCRAVAPGVERQRQATDLGAARGGMTSTARQTRRRRAHPGRPGGGGTGADPCAARRK
jgi:hypothetical protein